TSGTPFESTEDATSKPSPLTPYETTPETAPKTSAETTSETHPVNTSGTTPETTVQTSANPAPETTFTSKTTTTDAKTATTVMEIPPKPKPSDPSVRAITTTVDPGVIGTLVTHSIDGTPTLPSELYPIPSPEFSGIVTSWNTVDGSGNKSLNVKLVQIGLVVLACDTLIIRGTRQEYESYDISSTLSLVDVRDCDLNIVTVRSSGFFYFTTTFVNIATVLSFGNLYNKRVFYVDTTSSNSLQSITFDSIVNERYMVFKFQQTSLVVETSINSRGCIIINGDSSSLVTFPMSSENRGVISLNGGVQLIAQGMSSNGGILLKDESTFTLDDESCGNSICFVSNKKAILQVSQPPKDPIYVAGFGKNNVIRILSLWTTPPKFSYSGSLLTFSFDEHNYVFDIGERYSSDNFKFNSGVSEAELTCTVDPPSGSNTCRHSECQMTVSAAPGRMPEVSTKTTDGSTFTLTITTDESSWTTITASTEETTTDGTTTDEATTEQTTTEETTTEETIKMHSSIFLFCDTNSQRQSPWINLFPQKPPQKKPPQKKPPQKKPPQKKPPQKKPPQKKPPPKQVHWKKPPQEKKPPPEKNPPQEKNPSQEKNSSKKPRRANQRQEKQYSKEVRQEKQ
ncbi:uncharacterized protein J8A68_005323, partial [[Candida] subhashii]